MGLVEEGCMPASDDPLQEEDGNGEWKNKANNLQKVLLRILGSQVPLLGTLVALEVPLLTPSQRICCREHS